MPIKRLAKELFEQFYSREFSKFKSNETNQSEIKQAIEQKLKDLISNLELVPKEAFELQKADLQALHEKTKLLEARVKLYEEALSAKVGDLDEFLDSARSSSRTDSIDSV